MSIAEHDAGLIETDSLFGIRVCRNELTLRSEPSGISLLGEGAHRILCDVLYGAPTALTMGTVKCVFSERPLAKVESVTHASPTSVKAGLGRPLAWPIPQEWLLLEGHKAAWLWRRQLFRQIAFAKRANGVFYLAIGPAYYRIEVDPKESELFKADLLRYFPKSAALEETDRNAFSVWPESTYNGPLIRSRFTARKIEELPNYDPSVWEDDSATQKLLGSERPFVPAPQESLLVSP